VTNEADAIAFVPNAPAVVSETIAGETIIMHHRTGNYFDTAGTGTLLWEAINGGGATAGALAALLAPLRGATADAARTAVTRFIEMLLRHDLIRTVPVRAGSGIAVLEGMCLESFEAPVLGVHTDLADMLLLDPIHDVGEAGWPSLPSITESSVAR
jgi:hypothetical protein